MKLKPVVLLLLLLSSSLTFIPVPVHAAANASGLVGRWAFLEGSGTTTADLSGNGNTGTLTNSPTWSSTGGPFTGTGYVGFAGAQTINIADSPSIDIQTYTITGWVHPTSLGGSNQLIFRKGTSGAQNYIFYMNSNNYPTCSVSDGTNSPSVSSSVALTTAWYFVGCTVSLSGNIVVYVSGISEGSTTNTASGYTNSVGATIGGTNGGWSGYIAFLSIYNRALSASEISNDYKNGVYTLSAPGAAWDGITIMCDISCSSVGFNTKGGGSAGTYPYLTFSTEFAGTEVVYMPKNMFASGVLTGVAGVTNNNMANTAAYAVGASGYQFTPGTGILVETGASTHEIDFFPGPNCNFCATGVSVNGQTTTATSTGGGAGPPPALGPGIVVALALGAGVYFLMRRRGSES